MIRSIILGSQSPRRKELLHGIGMVFDIISPELDEVFPDEMNVYRVPEYLAKIKNDEIRSRVKDPSQLVLTADTVVILDGKIIGKPVDAADACSLLGRIQGKRQEVVTGVCITGGDKEVLFSDTTRVYFNPLTEEEIRYYVDKYSPLDKAGAYAIQEWIGFVGVAKIEGCFYNVMGLPVPKIYPILRDWQP